MDCNTIKNEHKILHDGTAQGDRAAFALQPDYVKIDEHSQADWIVFVRDYARFLQYYNQGNVANGDWKPFWSKNPSIALAVLATSRVDWFREETRQIFIEIQKLGNQSNELLLKQHLNRLFEAVATLAWRLDDLISTLPNELNIKFSLQNLISGSLASSFQKWIAWYKKANDIAPPFPVVDTGNNQITNDRIARMLILGDQPEAMNQVLTYTFSEDWILDGSPDWATYVANISADDTVFGSSPLVTSVADQINFVIRHFFFTNVYDSFIKGFSKAIQEAGIALNQILNQWNQHEPHFALFLSFLRLLTHERDYLNTLTERHLRFYYNRVLRLSENPSIPSFAHVVIELSKQTQAYLLNKGIAFKAGKDSLGKEIIFTLTEDFVPNQAKIVEFKNILKLPSNPALYQSTPDQPRYRSGDVQRYYAAPIANSEDGLGAELQTKEKHWQVFGNKKLNNTKTYWDIYMPKAELGFAITSHYLFLQDGARTIELTFNGLANGVLNGKRFNIYLTTEKNWHEQTITVVSNKLTINLAGDLPAILPYNPKVHGGSFVTDFPILKVILINADAQPYQYDSIKNLSLTSISLRVGVTGKKTMSLSGPSGPLDSSKPFYPFGAMPDNGASFYIGDKEVFQKNATVTMHFDWKEQHSFPAFRHPAAITQSLNNGDWVGNSGDILPHSGLQQSYSFTIASSDQLLPDFSKNTSYKPGDVAGFVRFVLVGDYGHKQYPLEFAKFMADKGTEPAHLLDDQLIAVSLDYHATTTIPLNNTNAYKGQLSRFLHLLPFGYEEITPSNYATRLLPKLVPQVGDNVGKDGAEWYIGIKDLKPPQVLSVLIQILDGSADPLIQKPENHVEWAYLSNNMWVNFKENELRDGTSSLLQSGIIQFTMPRNANTQHSILPTGLHWIRASVQQAVDAVCSAVGVHGQGALLALQNNQNDPQLNATPLAAGTIGKLLSPISAVKKIEQPYPAFGGKATENSTHFFTRVSERLRHKNRVVAMWDYERMVLEAFPSVHKIKCLNHLRFEPIDNTYIYRELAAGHVTVVTVSNLRNQPGVNPLRPYVSLGELKKIETFLKAHITCHATLHVRNPLFEPIQAVFKVRFFDGYDETFYTQLLNSEIIQFLSPWAFEATKDIGFGGKIYKAALINFIEERPYVDYLEDFKLIQLTVPPRPDQETIEPSTLCSILVSADQHHITVIKAAIPIGLSEDCGCGFPLP